MTPTRASLWRAYAIAPAVAPLSFAAIIALLGVACRQLAGTCNPASIGFLFVGGVILGPPLAYAVALLLMPLAFWLQSRNALTGYAIFGIALCVTTAIAAISPLAVTGDPPPYFGWFVYSAAGIGPPILLAALVFHLVAKHPTPATWPFPVLRVVLGVAGAVFVVAIAFALRGQTGTARTSEEQTRMALRSTLRSLMIAEESFFSEYGTYTADLDKLKERPDVPLDDTPGVILTVEEATDRGWYATARIADAPALSCWAYVGTTSRHGRAVAREGEPACE